MKQIYDVRLLLTTRHVKNVQIVAENAQQARTQGEVIAEESASDGQWEMVGFDTDVVTVERVGR